MIRRFSLKLSSLFLIVACVAAAQGVPPRKDIPAIAKAANGAIVSIVMSDKDGHAIAQGTGFLVSKDGHIVTNYHVIAEGTSALVKLPEGAYYVIDGVAASDKARDVAVIKAHGQNFRTVTLGNSDRVQVGEEVVAIGNPLSLESTVSNGIVSGIRTVQEDGGKFLQTTAPISPGSSGGPLFNMAGEVVGINTSYLKGGENLNFAIPINNAKRLLLAKSSKLQDLPNETEPAKVQTQDRDVSTSAHDYYQQLHDAGAFSDGIPSYVCFADDAPHSDSFLTFHALAYDENYSKAADKAMELSRANETGKVTEAQKQFNIAEVIQRKAPYVNFMFSSMFEALPPDEQEFFRNGGRILGSTLYTKGVKDIYTEYRWNENESAWLAKLIPRDQNAYVKTFVTLKLTIEPTTMRYLMSLELATTTGTGEPKATNTQTEAPHGGICVKIPKPKVK